MEKTINNINYNDYIKFETSLSDKEYKRLYKEAKREFEKYSNESFKEHACFISSSALHGFYFPNLENIRVVAFNKKTGKAEVIFNEN